MTGDKQRNLGQSGGTGRAQAGALASLDAIRLEADLREHAARLLERLPDAARGVYCRDSIADPDTCLAAITETVLYHFDAHNQRRVAEALGLAWSDLRLILVGFALGERLGYRNGVEATRARAAYSVLKVIPEAE